MNLHKRVSGGKAAESTDHYAEICIFLFKLWQIHLNLPLGMHMHFLFSVLTLIPQSSNPVDLSSAKMYFKRVRTCQDIFIANWQPEYIPVWQNMVSVIFCRFTGTRNSPGELLESELM